LPCLLPEQKTEMKIPQTHSQTIVVVGGYGVVGSKIANILARRNPGMRILIGGRSIENATATASTIKNAQGVTFDVDDPLSLYRLPVRPDLVIVAVNDLQDATLRAAIKAGIAIVDITRWTDRVRDLEAIVAEAKPEAPVIAGSSWMACIPGALTLSAVAGLDSVDSIDMSVLYAMKDVSGGNSVEYMDRLTAPFPVLREGKMAIAVPYTEGRTVKFENHYQTTVYRFDSPDQHVLPRLADAGSVAMRIAFDDKATTFIFWLIIRSGLWNLFGGDRFKSLRRRLLHNPGPGAPHRVRVDVAGKRAGCKLQRTLHVTDNEGQSHLTAVGAVLQTEWVLGLNGFSAPGNGLHYGEQMGPEAVLTDALAAEGVQISSLEVLV
jgi:saccharopine dehydrogenase-like NADP-dependent oxidoreductase